VHSNAMSDRTKNLVVWFVHVSFFHDSTALVGLDFLIVEVSRSRSIRQATLGRTPLDERSARRRGFYLTTHNTHNGQTTMPTAGYEHAFPAGKRPQTDSLDRAASGTSLSVCYCLFF
jgi:hypothetical protein